MSILFDDEIMEWAAGGWRNPGVPAWGPRKSPVLASDAKCSQMCMCLGSLVVVSSVLFLLDDNLWWVDSACTIVLALKFAKDGVNVVKVSYAEDFEGGCGCCA